MSTDNKSKEDFEEFNANAVTTQIIYQELAKATLKKVGSVQAFQAEAYHEIASALSNMVHNAGTYDIGYLANVVSRYQGYYREYMRQLAAASPTVSPPPPCTPPPLRSLTPKPPSPVQQPLPLDERND